MWCRTTGKLLLISYVSILRWILPTKLVPRMRKLHCTSWHQCLLIPKSFDCNWSSIIQRSGTTTTIEAVMAKFFAITKLWYIMDFPKPVGRTAITSLLDKSASTASSCPSLRTKPPTWSLKFTKTSLLLSFTTETIFPVIWSVDIKRVKKLITHQTCLTAAIVCGPIGIFHCWSNGKFERVCYS